MLVVGQGPIGLLLMQLARWSGARVVASDPLAQRRELALALGAEAVLDSSRGRLRRSCERRTQGRGADAVLVAATGATAMQQAIEAARPGSARALLRRDLARRDRGDRLRPADHRREGPADGLQLVGRYPGAAADLVFTRAVRVRELISHRFAIADAEQAFALALQPAPGTLKVVLQMGGTPA